MPALSDNPFEKPSFSFKANSKGEVWRYAEGVRVWKELELPSEAVATIVAMTLNEQTTDAYREGVASVSKATAIKEFLEFSWARDVYVCDVTQLLHPRMVGKTKVDKLINDFVDGG